MLQGYVGVPLDFGFHLPSLKQTFRNTENRPKLPQKEAGSSPFPGILQGPPVSSHDGSMGRLYIYLHASYKNQSFI